GWVISHISNNDTKKKRRINTSIDIVLNNIHTNESIHVGSSTAYTWQQGSRSQWLNDDLLMYNDYCVAQKSWVSNVFSLSNKNIVKTFNYPVQDSYSTEYFVSINYKRLQKVTEDYGYNNQEDL